MKSALSLLLVLLLVPWSPAEAASGDGPCSATMELTMKERDAIGMFHAYLSHLLYKYGKPDFEEALGKIVANSWPRAKVIQVAPTFYERAVNLVDQERLKNSIALTVGLDSPLWDPFNKDMGKITLMDGFAEVPGGYRPGRAPTLEKQTMKLLAAIRGSQPPPKRGFTREEFEQVKAEAIARVSEMYSYLMRWSMINRGLIDERGAASAKKIAVIGVGMIGAGVLVSTMMVSGPLVAGAGAYAGSLSTNPVVSALLVKLGEAAAGSLLGVVGAPAVHVIKDANHTLSEAGKRSANLQTSYACELSRQIDEWKAEGGGPYLSAALYGGAMGLGGGALTFTRASAQVVLYATGFGVGVAQLYSLGKMSSLAMESLAYYKLAEEAEAAGEHEKAVKLLYHSRDLAQDAREKGLESIIIGVLTHYLTEHFRTAMVEGENAIRVLYANSADTLPLAGKAAVSAATGSQNPIPLNQKEER
jgi:hypothetical protein